MRKKRRPSAKEALAHIQHAVATGRFEVAPGTKIAALDEEWVQRALELLGHPEALVTDYSSVWDFLGFGLTARERQAELRAISKKFGFPVQGGDLLYELAARLRTASTARVH